MTDERAARGEEIRRKLSEGQPLERIFPKKVWTPRPPAPFADNHADFVATDLPAIAGGSRVRRYLWDCQHTTSQLDLMDFTPDQDGEVLAQMQVTVRARAAQSGKVCLCWPKGWGAA